MSKHTPGPWRVVGTTANDSYFVEHGQMGEPGHVVIAGLRPETRRKIPRLLQDVADDARLIAAAPELLEALKDHIRWYDGGTPAPEIDERELIARTRAAIAKVEGK